MFTREVRFPFLTEIVGLWSLRLSSQAKGPQIRTLLRGNKTNSSEGIPRCNFLWRAPNRKHLPYSVSTYVGTKERSDRSY